MTQLLITPGDDNEALDQEKGIEVYQSLAKHYPRHPWRVDFQGRVLVVRHDRISAKAREMGVDGVGMMIKHLNSYSASELAHQAMIMGGEFLERWGYPRRGWDGESEPKPDLGTLKELLTRRHKQQLPESRIIVPDWARRVH